MQIVEYDTFVELGKDAMAPVGHKMIWVYEMYNVKHGICKNAILMTDGNINDVIVKSVYYRVSPLYVILLLVSLDEINEMEM